MKKLFTIALLALTIVTSAFANSSETVSKYVTNRFKTDFKNASEVSWTSKADYVKASFTLNDKKMEAYYNRRGEVIAKSTNISLDELPVNVKRSFAKKFEGYTVKEAILFEGTEENAYYISAENEKETVILKVDQDNQLKNFKRTKK